ncbi:calcium-activated chloride channel-domain-containing protein [Schizophyllum amplum]|uniref:Calcium-activated chloride channel-domain-containing protein n=1 Tax=Schizophyllum amplum TaxID=97359 RepID=A0A550CKY3_9AGAR|nr:calcium-activated chloride channel-domain-containing protein [Auriculariopsis ampla]
MGLQVDLVITFRTSTNAKRLTKDDVRKAEEQYARLIKTLKKAGLQAVGRRGESLGDLLVFVNCPEQVLTSLVRRERHSDFVSGLPTNPTSATADARQLCPADRIRIVHAYIASTQADGGLGINPGMPEWDKVDSVMTLHDPDFNERWITSWTKEKVDSSAIESLRQQFGESVALYFAFLKAYSHALVVPAALGAAFYVAGESYSPLYSTLILIWAVGFTEWWRVKEKIISLRFGSRGSFRVERRRAQYNPGFPWWKREMRILASLPLITLYALVLVALLTGIFVFEAFVTHLYQGPGQKILSLSPTILFTLLVPTFLGYYKKAAVRTTVWENHAHQSSHTASLTLKIFALSSLVAYLGLVLSAFVYVPFGEEIMQIVQVLLFHDQRGGKEAASEEPSFWNADTAAAKEKLNPGRLSDQMFAFTVTNQVVNTFLEVGLPFVMRRVAEFRNRKKDDSKKDDAKTESTSLSGRTSPSIASTSSIRKKVVFDDEREKGAGEEREFLDIVRKQAALPEYDLFTDYSEMATQFGYVVMWSTIWPLAPVMACINNFFELRSDAFKMTVHHRRPIPERTDTIGPWLEALSFLCWLGALTNSALVYLFHPASDRTAHLWASVEGFFTVSEGAQAATAHGLLTTAVIIALVASHAYVLGCTVVRHIVERVVWHGSREVKEWEREEREMKARLLQAELRVSGAETTSPQPRTPVEEDLGALKDFWEHDDGLEEINRLSKEA